MSFALGLVIGALTVWVFVAKPLLTRADIENQSLYRRISFLQAMLIWEQRK